MLHAMIMAGGGGTRFWPRSRQANPKQFLAVGGERTLIQTAYDRLEAMALPPANIRVLTGAAYVEQTRSQLPALPASNVVGEPCGRDTAPCVALGAALIRKDDPDATILVTPADHVIEPAQEFRRAARAAEQVVEENPRSLLTFGIPPTYPSTGYGYVHRGEAMTPRQGVGVFRVRGFREKPPLEEAEAFVASGASYWNAGIFVWKAATILDAVKTYEPEMYAGVTKIAAAWGTPEGEKTLNDVYPTLKKISIDFAVMQKYPDIVTVQAPYRWDDVGSWLAVERMHPQDADGNTVLATHAGLETRDCVVVGEQGRLIATMGVSDLVIIQDGDATLILPRSREGDVKALIDHIRAKNLGRHL